MIFSDSSHNNIVLKCLKLFALNLVANWNVFFNDALIFCYTVETRVGINHQPFDLNLDFLRLIHK